MRADGQNQLKILAPRPFIETYRLIPLLADKSRRTVPLNNKINFLLDLPCSMQYEQD